MHRDLRQFIPRTFWIVTLAAALVLGAIVAIPQWLSRQARLQVLRSHVAEIAQLAASVVDGDLHRRLLDPANYSPELYEKTLAPLVRFHSAAPEIFYVYTMVDRDGQSYFVVDTAASPDLKTKHKLRASSYMEPFTALDEEPDPNWLQRIAAGETYVYPNFQRDAYGNFLSGHTPIYDSQGRYSGFVGVDFDIDYYLAQEASFRAISIGTLAAAVIAALFVGYLTSRYHFDLNHRIEEQYRISIHDELTKLLNRRGALLAANDALQAQASSYAAIIVDVDDLKGINDRHGHAAGDDFLRKVAEAMRESVREKDTCARLGGDEFLIFATGCDLDAATEIARRILTRVYKDDSTAGRSHFGVSIGICVAPRAEAGFDAMYRRADQALYEAKSAGRNRYVIFGPVAVA
jgi:diguanylate cyclase (GGDEF)-like protein